MGPVNVLAGAASGFRHDAVPYRGTKGFLERVGAFIDDALGNEEPILVVVSQEKISLLRDALGEHARDVRFADMSSVGRNPARIIPAWADFVEEHASSGRPFRGVGEPIWAERTPDELIECERHEALLNVAFDDGPAWWLACPYDVESLAPRVVEEAARNHPGILDLHRRYQSASYPGSRSLAEPFDAPLPPPPAGVDTVAFDESVESDISLVDVRRFVASVASTLGLASDRIDDLVLAVAEACANTVAHGSGVGVVRLWRASSSIVCEVEGSGRIEDPLVGRRRPRYGSSGYGVWIIHQLCDLVQIRSFSDSSVVRMHMYTA